MPIILLGYGLKVAGAVGMTLSGTAIVVKVLIDTGVIVP